MLANESEFVGYKGREKQKQNRISNKQKKSHYLRNANRHGWIRITYNTTHRQRQNFYYYTRIRG